MSKKSRKEIEINGCKHLVYYGVLKASEFEDLKGEEIFAPVSYDKNINRLMKEIRNKGHQELKLVETKNYMLSYEQLISGTRRAMVLNSSF